MKSASPQRSAALAAFMEREKIYVNLADIARMVEVASKMGRLASGMATDKTEVTGEEGGPIRVEVEAALDKIYGKPIPGEVVDVEADADADAVPALQPEGKAMTKLERYLAMGQRAGCPRDQMRQLRAG